MARIEGVQDRILSCAGPRSVDNYVASETGEGAYRPAATASREGVGDATLARGGGSFLRRVRGPFRLGVCRSRDFHRSSLTRRADRARTRELAYDARRPGMWGRSPRTSMPERFVAPARSGPVLSVRREMLRRRWGESSIRQRHLVYGTAKQSPSESRPAGVSLTKRTKRVVVWATKKRLRITERPQSGGAKRKTKHDTPRRWCGVG